MKIWSEIQNEVFVLFMQNDNEVFNCAFNLTKDIEYAEDMIDVLIPMIKSLSMKLLPLIPLKIQIEREIDVLKNEIYLKERLLKSLV